MPKAAKKLDPKRVDQVKGVVLTQTFCLEFEGKRQTYVAFFSRYTEDLRQLYNLLIYRKKSTTSNAEVLGRNLTKDRVVDIIEKLEGLL
jgi:hypothetical protein